MAETTVHRDYNKASNQGKKSRISATLYKGEGRLGASLQTVTDQATLAAMGKASAPADAALRVYRRPAGNPVNAKTQESPQQAVPREGTLKKRTYEDKLWETYCKTRSKEARNALWVYYLPLVRYIAERVKARLPGCVEFVDLVSAGSCALQEAIAKFDPKLSIHFQTYCLTRIRGAILDYVRNMNWIPRIIRNKAHQFEKVKGELAAKLRRDPTDEEIARRLGISAQDFQELQKELEVKAVIPVGTYNKARQFVKVKGELAVRLRRQPTDEEFCRELGISPQDFQELQSELDVKGAVSLRCFERQRKWLFSQYPGKFVLYYGPKREGVYDTDQEALAAGFRKFSGTGFFVRKITPSSPQLYLDLELR
ncbi:MAG: sigma-70 family RNA polymerase sigma factor [Planctomycetota bacterium]